MVDEKYLPSFDELAEEFQAIELDNALGQYQAATEARLAQHEANVRSMRLGSQGYSFEGVTALDGDTAYDSRNNQSYRLNPGRVGEEGYSLDTFEIEKLNPETGMMENPYLKTDRASKKKTRNHKKAYARLMGIEDWTTVTPEQLVAEGAKQTQRLQQFIDEQLEAGNTFSLGDPDMYNRRLMSMDQGDIRPWTSEEAFNASAQAPFNYKGYLESVYNGTALKEGGTFESRNPLEWVWDEGATALGDFVVDFGTGALQLATQSIGLMGDVATAEIADTDDPELKRQAEAFNRLMSGPSKFISEVNTAATEIINEARTDKGQLVRQRRENRSRANEAIREKTYNKFIEAGYSPWESTVAGFWATAGNTLGFFKEDPMEAVSISMNSWPYLVGIGWGGKKLLNRAQNQLNKNKRTKIEDRLGNKRKSKVDAERERLRRNGATDRDLRAFDTRMEHELRQAVDKKILQLAGLKARGQTALLIGGSEAVSNTNAVVGELLQVTDEQWKESPEYQKLVGEGMSHEDAIDYLISSNAVMAGVLTFGISTVASLLTGAAGVEMSMFTKGGLFRHFARGGMVKEANSALGKVFNTTVDIGKRTAKTAWDISEAGIKEMAEESIQSGVAGAGVSDFAVSRATGEEFQARGVGEATAVGAVAGLVSAGKIQAIRSAATGSAIAWAKYKDKKEQTDFDKRLKRLGLTFSGDSVVADETRQEVKENVIELLKALDDDITNKPDLGSASINKLFEHLEVLVNTISQTPNGDTEVALDVETVALLAKGIRALAITVSRGRENPDLTAEEQAAYETATKAIASLKGTKIEKLLVESRAGLLRRHLELTKKAYKDGYSSLTEDEAMELAQIDNFRRAVKDGEFGPDLNGSFDTSSLESPDNATGSFAANEVIALRLAEREAANEESEDDQAAPGTQHALPLNNPGVETGQTSDDGREVRPVTERSLIGGAARAMQMFKQGVQTLERIVGDFYSGKSTQDVNRELEKTGGDKGQSIPQLLREAATEILDKLNNKLKPGANAALSHLRLIQTKQRDKLDWFTALDNIGKLTGWSGFSLNWEKLDEELARIHEQIKKNTGSKQKADDAVADIKRLAGKGSSIYEWVRPSVGAQGKKTKGYGYWNKQPDRNILELQSFILQELEMINDSVQRLRQVLVKTNQLTEEQINEIIIPYEDGTVVRTPKIVLVDDFDTVQQSEEVKEDDKAKDEDPDEGVDANDESEAETGDRKTDGKPEEGDKESGKDRSSDDGPVEPEEEAEEQQDQEEEVKPGTQGELFPKEEETIPPEDELPKGQTSDQEAPETDPAQQDLFPRTGDATEEQVAEDEANAEDARQPGSEESGPQQTPQTRLQWEADNLEKRIKEFVDPNKPNAVIEFLKNNELSKKLGSYYTTVAYTEDKEGNRTFRGKPVLDYLAMREKFLKDRFEDTLKGNELVSAVTRRLVYGNKLPTNLSQIVKKSKNKVGGILAHSWLWAEEGMKAWWQRNFLDIVRWSTEVDGERDLKAEAAFFALNSAAWKMVDAMRDMLATPEQVLDRTVPKDSPGKHKPLGTGTSEKGTPTFADQMRDVMQIYLYGGTKEDGTSKPIPDETLHAIAVQTLVWAITEGSGSLMNTDDSIASILGINESRFNGLDDKIYMRELFRHGKLMSHTANTIGRAAVESLGWGPGSAKHAVNPALFAKLVKTMGYVGIHSLGQVDGLFDNPAVQQKWREAGVTTNTTLPKGAKLLKRKYVESSEVGVFTRANSNLRFRRSTPDGRMYLVYPDDTNVDATIELLENLKAGLRAYRIFGATMAKDDVTFDKPTLEDIPTHLSGDSHSRIPQEQRIAMLMQAQMEYKLSMPLATLLDLFEDDEVFLQEIMGVQSLADIEARTYEGDQSAEMAKRQEEVRRLRQARGLIDQMRLGDTEDVGFYFFQRMITSGRMYLNGSEVNPQQSKLHRYLFPQAASMNKKISLKSKEDMLKFQRTILLAMDKEIRNPEGDGKRGVDAMTDDEVRQVFAAEFDNNDGLKKTILELRTAVHTKEALSEELTKAVGEIAKSGEHGMWALQAMLALGNYYEAQRDNKSSFISDLSMEVDGKTNGVIINMLQMPGALTQDGKINPKILAMLRAGGIYFEGDDVQTLAEYMSDPANRDNYNQLVDTVKQFALETLSTGYFNYEGRTTELEASETSGRVYFVDGAAVRESDHGLIAQRIGGANENGDYNPQLLRVAPMQERFGNPAWHALAARTLMDSTLNPFVELNRNFGKPPLMTKAYSAGEYAIRVNMENIALDAYYAAKTKVLRDLEILVPDENMKWKLELDGVNHTEEGFDVETAANHVLAAYSEFALVDASQKIVRMTADPDYFRFVLAQLITMDSMPEYNGLGIVPSENDNGTSLQARAQAWAKKPATGKPKEDAATIVQYLLAMVGTERNAGTAIDSMHQLHHAMAESMTQLRTNQYRKDLAEGNGVEKLVALVNEMRKGKLGDVDENANPEKRRHEESAKNAFFVGLQAVFGTALEHALNEQLGGGVALKNELNGLMDMYNYMFVLNYRRRAKRQEQADGHALSKQAQVDLLNDMIVKGEVPMIKVPFSKNKYSDSLEISNYTSAILEDSDVRHERGRIVFSKPTMAADVKNSETERVGSQQSFSFDLGQISPSEELGAKALVNLVHATDASVQGGALTESKIDFLNVHDAQISSVLDYEELTVAANKSFYDRMRDWDMAGSITERLEDFLPRLQAGDFRLTQEQKLATMRRYIGSNLRGYQRTQWNDGSLFTIAGQFTTEAQYVRKIDINQLGIPGVEDILRAANVPVDEDGEVKVDRLGAFMADPDNVMKLFRAKMLHMQQLVNDNHQARETIFGEKGIKTVGQFALFGHEYKIGKKQQQNKPRGPFQVRSLLSEDQKTLEEYLKDDRARGLSDPLRQLEAALDEAYSDANTTAKNTDSLWLDWLEQYQGDLNALDVFEVVIRSLKKSVERRTKLLGIQPDQDFSMKYLDDLAQMIKGGAPTNVPIVVQPTSFGEYLAAIQTTILPDGSEEGQFRSQLLIGVKELRDSSKPFEEAFLHEMVHLTHRNWEKKNGSILYWADDEDAKIRVEQNLDMLNTFIENMAKTMEGMLAQIINLAVTEGDLKPYREQVAVFHRMYTYFYELGFGPRDENNRRIRPRDIVKTMLNRYTELFEQDRKTTDIFKFHTVKFTIDDLAVKGTMANEMRSFGFETNIPHSAVTSFQSNLRHLVAEMLAEVTTGFNMRSLGTYKDLVEKTSLTEDEGGPYEIFGNVKAQGPGPNQMSSILPMGPMYDYSWFRQNTLQTLYRSVANSKGRVVLYANPEAFNTTHFDDLNDMDYLPKDELLNTISHIANLQRQRGQISREEQEFLDRFLDDNTTTGKLFKQGLANLDNLLFQFIEDPEAYTNTGRTRRWADVATPTKIEIVLATAMADNEVNMTQQEVFLHESFHALTGMMFGDSAITDELRRDPRNRSKMDSIRGKFADLHTRLKEDSNWEMLLEGIPEGDITDAMRIRAQNKWNRLFADVTTRSNTKAAFAEAEANRERQLQEFVVMAYTNPGVNRLISAVPTRNFSWKQFSDRVRNQERGGYRLAVVELVGEIMSWLGSLLRTRNPSLQGQFDTLLHKMVWTAAKHKRLAKKKREKYSLSSMIAKLSADEFMKLIQRKQGVFLKWLEEHENWENIKDSDDVTTRKKIWEEVKRTLRLQTDPNKINWEQFRETFHQFLLQWEDSTELLQGDKVQTVGQNLYELMTEFLPETVDHRFWLNLKLKSDKLVDVTRQQAITGIKAFTDRIWAKDNKPTTTKAKEALFYGILRTDASSLLNDGNVTFDHSDIMEALISPTKRQQMLQQLDQEIDKLGFGRTKSNFARQYRAYIDLQMEGLAHFMMFGTTPVHGQMKNAFNIINRRHADRRTTASLLEARANQPARQQMEDLVNKMITLKAMEHLTEAQVGELRTIIMGEQARSLPASENGMGQLLNMHSSYKISADEKLFEGDPTDQIKGYTYDTFDSERSVEVVEYKGPETDKEMAKRGMKPVRDVYNMDQLWAQLREQLADDHLVPPGAALNSGKFRMYVGSQGLATFDKGIMSTTTEAGAGQSLFDIAVQGLNNLLDDDGMLDPAILKSTAKASRQVKLNMRKQQERLAEEQLKQFLRTGKIRKQDKVVPVATLDQNGYVSDYRYIMSDQEKEVLLHRRQNYDETLARMFGSIQDKLGTRDINSEAVRGMIQAYLDASPIERRRNFIQIGPDVADKESREMWAMMPPATRQMFAEEFGQRVAFIPRHHKNLIMGYRKVLFSNNQFLGPAAPIVRWIELLWQSMMKYRRYQIAILMPRTVIGNFISNISLMWSKGVPIGFLIRESFEAIKAVDRYRNDAKEANIIETEMAALWQQGIMKGNNYAKWTKLGDRRAALVNNMKTSTAGQLVEDGLFTSIVDDIGFNEESFAGKNMQRLTDFMGGERRWGQTALGVAQNLFMLPGSELGTAAMLMTQYSDFMGRFVLYKYRTMIDKVSEESAKFEALRTFIYYNTPQNKYLQYMNDMGMFMFSKFLFRIQPVIVSMAYQQTARSMAMHGLQQGMFSDGLDEHIYKYNLPLQPMALWNKLDLGPWRHVLGNEYWLPGILRWIPNAFWDV